MNDELDILDDLDFDLWFDLFSDIVKKEHRYRGPIDKYGVEGYYDEAKTPELAAQLFMDEMNAQ